MSKNPEKPQSRLKILVPVPTFPENPGPVRLYFEGCSGAEITERFEVSQLCAAFLNCKGILSGGSARKYKDDIGTDIEALCIIGNRGLGAYSLRF
jgi:hypothetical protein